MFLHAVKYEINPVSDKPTSETVETETTDEPAATVVNPDYQSVEGQNFKIRRGKVEQVYHLDK